MTDSARILVYDIETSPIEARTWGPKWQTNLLEVLQPAKLITIAWHWVGERKTHVEGVDDHGFVGGGPAAVDDAPLARRLHELFLDSDIRVAHNGDQFDEKVTRARIAAAGLTAPPPPVTVDTKKVVKAAWRLPSNSLNDVADYFGLGRKLQTGGYELWRGFLDGDPRAMSKMKRYCKQDVVLLTKLYYHLRDGGWIPRHPHVGVIEGNRGACQACGSPHAQRRGLRHTNAYSYVKYQCMACGTYRQGRIRQER